MKRVIYCFSVFLMCFSNCANTQPANTESMQSNNVESIGEYFSTTMTLYDQNRQPYLGMVEMNEKEAFIELVRQILDNPDYEYSSFQNDLYYIAQIYNAFSVGEFTGRDASNYEPINSSGTQTTFRNKDNGQLMDIRTQLIRGRYSELIKYLEDAGYYIHTKTLGNTQTILIIDYRVPTTVQPVQPPTIQTYRIGDTGPAGGIVFYDKGNNSDGWRYLEAAPSTTDRVDQNVFAATSLYSQVSNRSVGAGLNNTRMYIERLHRNNVAANTALHYCNNLIHNGFNDWFLPSIEELRLIYNNLRNNSNAVFLPRKYWSSTCDSGGAALFIDFSNGQETYGDWSGTMRIRAIRRF